MNFVYASLADHWWVFVGIGACGILYTWKGPQ